MNFADYIVKKIPTCNKFDLIARHTSEVMLLALDDQAQFQILEDILHAFEPAWPKWCNTNGLCIHADSSSNTMGSPNMGAFVVHLIDYIGHDNIFHGLTMELARPWLAVEILCDCQVFGVDIMQMRLLMSISTHFFKVASSSLFSLTVDIISILFFASVQLGLLSPEARDALVDYLVVSTLGISSTGDPLQHTIVANILSICMKPIPRSMVPDIIVKVLRDILVRLFNQRMSR